MCTPLTAAANAGEELRGIVQAAAPERQGEREERGGIWWVVRREQVGEKVERG